MTEKTPILYVDDEENNLIAFKAFFRKEYAVHTVLNAAEALTYLDENQPHIIVTDQRMPGMSGIEFLEKTIIKQPDAVRLIITGQSDIDMVIDAINRGQVTKYISKPWDWDKLSLILSNCIDIYKAKMELKLKNEQLQRTNDDLNRFIYSISHDLRAPLMSILGVVQLGKLNPEVKGADTLFYHIESSVHKLDNYIKSVIDYYKNNRVEASDDQIDFRELIEDICESLNDHDGKIEFNINISQTSPFISDLFRSRVILSNLISNAIKYKSREREKAIINIDIRTNDEAATWIVADNGIGISPENLENIFKLFFRSKNTQHIQGSGIGLFIVKEAVEKLKGTINVTSQPGEGSKFEVVVPNKNKQQHAG